MTTDTPSLIDGAAERAMLGVLIREPGRFRDKRLSRALFALETHRFSALQAAAARGELAGDLMTATAALTATGQAGASVWVAEALMAAEDLVPEPLLRHLQKLAARRTTRRLADSLRAVAEHPTPGDDRETLATISEQVAALTHPEAPPGRLLSSVKAERVAWLWDRRIPCGKLTLLDGDPGIGKTALVLDLAARVSRGIPLPDEREDRAWPPAGVVLVNAEDGLGDTVRPRLEAAGADLDRIRAFGVDHLLTLPDDLPTLREAIEAVGASLVIIDPFMAVLHPSIDSHRDQDVRRVLAQLADVAAATGAAIVIVRHLTKTTGGRALYRGGGSIGIAGAARSVLLVAPDPEDNARRILVGVKHNLSPAPPALAFRLDSRGDAVAVDWVGRTSMEADALVATDSASVGEAVHVLEQILEDGPVAARFAERARREAGISDYAWREARRRVGVVTEKEAFSGGWVLRTRAPEGRRAS